MDFVTLGRPQAPMAKELSISHQGELRSLSNAEIINAFEQDIAIAENFRSQIKKFSIDFIDIAPFVDPSRPDSKQALELYAQYNAMRSNSSANSLKSLMQVSKQWIEFNCSIGNFPFPGNPTVLATYLQRLEAGGAKLATIKAHVSQISKLHKTLNLANPCHSEIVSSHVELITEAMFESEDPRAESKQASPFRHEHLKLVKELYEDRDTLEHARDLAFLCTAYATSLRSEELARIKVKHLTYNDDQSLSLERFKAKNKKGNLRGREIPHSYAKHITHYFEKAEFESTENYLFGPLSKSKSKIIKNESPISTKSLSRIFERAYLNLNPTLKKRKEVLSTQLGKEAPKALYTPNLNIWTAHSARVGSVVDAYENRRKLGLTDADLMAMGDWTTLRMVMIYTRNAREKETGNSRRLQMLEL
ncbi:tyrosine-type recombinase/integrase [Vibrio breoganii]